MVLRRKQIEERVHQKWGHRFTKTEWNRFVKWTKERKEQMKCLDVSMIYVSYLIWDKLYHSPLDNFLCISGAEGVGKSTLAMQIASCVFPDFNAGNIVDNSESYLRLMQKAGEERINNPQEFKYEAIILDEGTDLLATEHATQEGRSVVKSFLMQRKLKRFVIACIPDYFDLNKKVQRRLNNLINIYVVNDKRLKKKRRGYKAFRKNAIKVLRDAKKKHPHIEVMDVKLPDDSFWYGVVNQRIPPNVNWDEYETKAIKDIIISIGKSINVLENKKKAQKEGDMPRELGSEGDTGFPNTM